MNTYTAVKMRIIELCEERKWSINKLATEAGIASSTIKGILYGRSKNPGIVTIKILCDGFGINLVEFFNTKAISELEQEIK